jgi:Ca-activated chloride channel family protein
MTIAITPMSPAELDRVTPSVDDAGVGALRTERGNLPLDALDVRVTITGLVSRVRLTQDFVNAYDTDLEATYVFPLPDRAAVTGMTMTADGRVIEAELRERGAARETYDRAIDAGQRAAIAEEERPDVFTMRVGNIRPRERVTVALCLVGPLPYEDGAATFRFPLVVAPRYVPGTPLPGPSVGDGHAVDTDAVPDASRVTPPVLLPGFPNPVRLSIDVDIDPAGLPLGDVRSSLHAVSGEDGRLSIRPGERADRDFVLRLAYGTTGDASTLVCAPDASGEEGTYQLTVLPPAVGGPSRGRDVVLLLDRSGSMGGWKMVAARRAAARIVDTLTAGDRFSVITFDHQVEHPTGLSGGLVEASDRHRFRAVEHLARADARGGTEILAPLRDGLRLLAGDSPREPVLVLVTDGQVGNEDQILHEITPLIGRIRLHTVGIDRAVNAGFLGRLAALGGGRCELVESEDRLDEAMEHINRRIGSPLITDLTITANGLTLVDGTRTPARLPGVYPGVPLVVAGRYRGAATGSFTVNGHTRDDGGWETTVAAQRRDAPAITELWARSQLRDLEDRYVAGASELEQRTVDTSLRFGVLCRFTAYVAVDTRVVTKGGRPHRVIQPVEPASGWHMLAPPPPPAGGGMRLMAALSQAGAPTMGAAAMPARMPGTMATSGHLGAGMLRLPPRTGRRAGAGDAAWGVHPQLLSTRELAAIEAQRLRAATGRPDYERRELLADLASRLAALISHLASLGIPEAAYAPLRRLVERLHAGGDLESLWAEALRILDTFAATVGVAAPAPAPGQPPATDAVPPATRAVPPATRAVPPAARGVPPHNQPASDDRRRSFWKR